jgi:hypothetical protein
MKERGSIVLAGAALLALLLGWTPIGSAAREAVLPANSVGTAQLRNGAVTGIKVRDRSLSARDFKGGQLPAGPRGARGQRGMRGPRGTRGASGPVGPSAAYTFSADGPTAVPVGTSPALIAQLSLPEPGAYVIDAKAYFDSSGSGIPELTCVLDTREGRTDEVRLLATNPTPVELSVAQSYPAGGSVELRCAGRAPADAHFVRITAIKVGELTANGSG